jgi:hypothetical protein
VLRCPFGCAQGFGLPPQARRRDGLRREEGFAYHLFAALKGRSSTEHSRGGCATRVWLRGPPPSHAKHASRSPGLRREEGFFRISFHGPEGPFFHRAQPGAAVPHGYGCVRAGTRKEIFSLAYPALVPQRAKRASETYRAAIVRHWRDLSFSTRRAFRRFIQVVPQKSAILAQKTLAFVLYSCYKVSCWSDRTIHLRALQSRPNGKPTTAGDPAP